MTGIQNRGRTATILLRGSNKLVLEEAERSLHDALCVIRCLVHKRALIPGGAAPEMEVEHQLIQWAKTLQARHFPASSFEGWSQNPARIQTAGPCSTHDDTPDPALQAVRSAGQMRASICLLVSCEQTG